MKSLMIGQVSKEYGAPITTGAALVAIELAKQSTNDLKIALYATNISSKKARRIRDFQAFGFNKNWIVYLWELIRNPFKGLQHLFFYKSRMGVNPLRFFFYEVNIRKAIRIFRPDIIHTHGLTQYMSAYFAANGKVPLVATLHGYWHTDERGAKVVNATMPFVNNITTLTLMAKNDIIQDYPKKYSHFDIVANGADTNKFYYSEKRRTELRKQLNIDDGTIVFITVASIQERKGQLRFLQYLYESGIDNYRYLIVGMGDGEYMDRLKQYISDKQLSEKVNMLGYVDNREMYGYYSASDVYAHVSTNEGQSLSEIEAASTGLRVIVNKPLVGTMPENINDSKWRFYVLDYESASYSVFDEWLKINNNKRSSANHYGWQYVVDKYCTVFSNISKDYK